MKYFFNRSKFLASSSKDLNIRLPYNGEDVCFAHDDSEIGISKINGIAVNREWCQPYVTTIDAAEHLYRYPEKLYKRVGDGQTMRIAEDGGYDIMPGFRRIKPNDRWIEVEQEKEVTFTEVVKAFIEGKTIVCKFQNRSFAYGPGISEFLEARAEEILHGRWFIRK